MSGHVFFKKVQVGKVYIDSLLAPRTLNSRGNQFANISENNVLANISESTVSINELWIYISINKENVKRHPILIKLYLGSSENK